jgi:hypothetical protein
VLKIFITPFPGSPLSHFTVDESRYRKFTVGHLSETRYINDREGEAWTMGINDEVRSISYSPAADDLHLQCPGWPRVNTTNCEYISDPYVSVGDIDFELDKFYLDNFYVVLSEKKATGYIIAYGGKRARPDEARQRADRAKQYLLTVRHVANDNVKVIDGGYREKRDMELYVVSEGVCPPIAVPTVDPRDVEIIAGGRKRR